jgi:phenylacetate-CoA ligase
VAPYLSRVAAERLAPDDGARLERLRLTLEQASRAPFHASRLSGHGVRSIADLSSLPLLTKRDLKENPAWSFLAVPREKVWHFHESFGTTGKPVPGWYSLDDLEVELDIITRWIEPFAPGKVVMNRYPYAFPVPAQLVEAAARLKGGALIPTSNLTYNVGPPRVLDLFERLKVNVVTAMPLEGVLLKEAAIELGKDPKKDFPDLEAFCYAGRILTPTWRRSMEEDWNVPIRNLYGTTEGGPIATSCPHGHLHLHDNAFLFEILDPETKRPLQGESVEGGLCLTTLTREAQPMIRYYTEDLVRTLAGVCPCGHPAQRIEVLGRAGDALRHGGVGLQPFDVEEQILQWSMEFGSNVFFVIITHRGFLVRVEAREPRRVDAAAGSRRLTERLGVPVRVEVCERGVLINHVSLIAQAAVFKPRMIVDHRVDKKKIINYSAALIDFWAEMTPRLVRKYVWKWFQDQVTSWRLRMLG